MSEKIKIVCNKCVWKYGDDECVTDSDYNPPKCFKSNQIWKLIETPATTIITDSIGNKKDFEYTIFTIEKR